MLERTGFSSALPVCLLKLGFAEVQEHNDFIGISV